MHKIFLHRSPSCSAWRTLQYTPSGHPSSSPGSLPSPWTSPEWTLTSGTVCKSTTSPGKRLHSPPTACSVYETQFYFTAPNRSRCDLFEFRVFAVNQVGNGTLTSVNGTFHASKYQTYIYNQLMIPTEP